MKVTAVLSVIAATSIGRAVAAPVSDTALASRSENSVHAALGADRAANVMKAFKTLAKEWCTPTYPYTCTSLIDNGEDYVYDGSTHGQGVRVNDSGTITYNYGETQLIMHPDGSIAFKDPWGQNCNVTKMKGAGCSFYNYLTQGTNTLPGTVEQCLKFGLACGN